MITLQDIQAHNLQVMHSSAYPYDVVRRRLRTVAERLLDGDESDRAGPWSETPKEAWLPLLPAFTLHAFLTEYRNRQRSVMSVSVGKYRRVMLMVQSVHSPYPQSFPRPGPASWLHHFSGNGFNYWIIGS